MNNRKNIVVDGRLVPVSQVKHWRLSPESVDPWGREWQLLDSVKEAWEQLDASRVEGMLGEKFTYGSHWVAESLDKAGYLHYLPGKFATIEKTGTKPEVRIAVLHESLTPGVFPFALHLTQGKVRTLLTFTFRGGRIDGLYMTDPELFTCEPTFRKGGILDENGEPRAFVHRCTEGDAGREMTEPEEREFAVECIAGLFEESGACVSKVYKGGDREFPNIVVRSGADTFYHRVEMERDAGQGVAEFGKTARGNGAWASVFDVSQYCFDTGGGRPVCGGTFAMKVMEGRSVPPHG